MTKPNSNKYPDGKGKFSIFATGINKPTIVTIGSACNNGNIEFTVKYLQSLGYTSIVIVYR